MRYLSWCQSERAIEGCNQNKLQTENRLGIVKFIPLQMKDTSLDVLGPLYVPLNKYESALTLGVRV